VRVRLFPIRFFFRHFFCRQHRCVDQALLQSGTAREGTGETSRDKHSSSEGKGVAACAPLLSVDFLGRFFLKRGRRSLSLDPLFLVLLRVRGLGRGRDSNVLPRERAVQEGYKEVGLRVFGVSEC